MLKKHPEQTPFGPCQLVFHGYNLFCGDGENAGLGCPITEAPAHTSQQGSPRSNRKLLWARTWAPHKGWEGREGDRTNIKESW